MLFRSPLKLANFRDQRIGDKFQLLISKKEVDVDYVAVDMSGLVGGGLRMAKTVATEQRRNKEVARYVTQGLNQLLKRFHIAKGLALFFDGSEPIHKAHQTRSANVTRRLESRLLRLPATPLMQSIEDRVVRMLPESRTYPPQITVSGTCAPGPVEVKMAGWALDIASKDLDSPLDKVSPATPPPASITACSDTICLIGSNELYLTSLALTPFVNISNMVQNSADLKQLRLQELLEWLALDDIAKGSDRTRLNRMRTDVVLLFILGQGCSAMELDGVHQLILADLFGAYLSGHSRPSDTESQKPPCFLFEEKENEFELSLVSLLSILTKCFRKQGYPKNCSLSESYLELALQSHHMTCVGTMADPYVALAASGPTSTAPTLAALTGHVGYLIANGRMTMRCRKNLLRPMSAAEYTVLSQSQPVAIESLVNQFVGAQVRPETAKRIAAEGKASSALEMINDLLLHANPAKAHKCLCLSPSYFWQQNPRSKLWSFRYVDLGRRSLSVDGRKVKGNVSGAGMSFAASADGPCYFLSSTSTWQPIEGFPFHAPAENSPDAVPQQLKVLSWNVMFDRYSGKPTPLGMPGIDWCSLKRYPVLSKVMERSNADVIGMQEVEPQFWEFLSKQEWVRKNYAFSCNAGGSPIQPWGVLMMVHRRLRVAHLTHYNVPAWNGHVSLLPVLTVDFHGNPLHVAGVHLLAPFTKGNESARTGQDAALKQRLSKISGDVVAMGDFNDWPTNEFVMPPESNFAEVWPWLHPNNPGKTMDETNTFCKLKIEEIFFGRSDKVFVRSKRLRPISATLVGTKSVNEENGNSDAPAYLFPSDHYGVQVTFTV